MSTIKEENLDVTSPETVEQNSEKSEASKDKVSDISPLWWLDSNSKSV